MGSARPSSRRRFAAATIRSSAASGKTIRRRRPRIRAMQVSRTFIERKGNRAELRTDPSQEAKLGRVLHNNGMEYLRSYLSDAGFGPSVALVLVFYALLRGTRDSMWRIAVLSLPGTLAHELMHFIVGTFLLAKPR